MYLALTGCRGFLGHHLVRHLIGAGHYVLGIDAETYAGLHPMPEHPNAKYLKADIATLDHLPDVEVVINCAAETHVDNSLASSKSFVHSNIVGVWNLLDLVRGKRAFQMPRFIQISTDEVLGSLSVGQANIDAPLIPANPYAASKAAAEVLVRALGHTHEIPYQIIRPTNLYGIGQYPEKLIPRTIRSIQLGRRMPIHDDGSAIRHWLNVQDACTGILAILYNGELNTTYHLGGNTETSVKSVAGFVCEQMGMAWTDVLEFGYNRQSLDRRYCLDDIATRELGWTPMGRLRDDLPYIIAFEREHFRW